MKAEMLDDPITVDRVATADEILAAVLSSPNPVEHCDAQILRQIASDVGGYVSMPALESEISLIMSGLTREQNAKPN